MVTKNLGTYLAMLGLTAFIVVGLFGLGHTAGMRANDDGNMEGCIFTGKTMLCQMGIIEHISLWQGMFTATPQKVYALLALVVLLIAAVFVVIHYLRHSADREQIISSYLYILRHPDISLFDPLRRAFSRGIIHPKIYKFANLSYLRALPTVVLPARRSFGAGRVVWQAFV
ncbi:MAG: hypothetical protein HY445_01420, partial [Candidatus Niyogibacteria bacterium]|nr:hypothetical protein [Candidatus Niyogibacteria bacterium]